MTEPGLDQPTRMRLQRSLSLNDVDNVRNVRNYCLFFVEALWPSQPNGVMLSVVSLPNHTFTGQA